jgi:hypothetical protein
MEFSFSFRSASLLHFSAQKAEERETLQNNTKCKRELCLCSVMNIRLSETTIVPLVFKTISMKYAHKVCSNLILPLPES